MTKSSPFKLYKQEPVKLLFKELHPLSSMLFIVVSSLFCANKLHYCVMLSCG